MGDQQSGHSLVEEAGRRYIIPKMRLSRLMISSWCSTLGVALGVVRHSATPGAGGPSGKIELLYRKAREHMQTDT